MPKKSGSLKMRCPFNKIIYTGVVGGIFALFGLLGVLFWREIFTYGLGKEIALRPDSRVYESWKSPPMALNLDIYFFNWTNPEDFRNASIKPIMEQLGPYRFKENSDKIDIVWHQENYSVTYRKKSLFYFDLDGSSGSLDDEICTLNAIALSAAGKAKQWGSMKRNVVDISLKLYGQSIFIRKTADELLFTGYQDDMIDVARLAPIFGAEVEVPFDRFGWFYTRNGSADLMGTFNMYTGVDDIYKFGKINSWNYKSHTGFSDSYCGMVNGSAGEFYPPNLKEGGHVSLFSPDMCRSIRLDYVETVEVKGIKGLKFSGGLRSVDNGTLFPENICFCGGKCVPSGVMNITACRYGSPVFMSYPHFYNADPIFNEQVQGLSPSKKDHEFYMILEPITGVPLEVAARFQVNMLIEPIEHMSLYEDVPRVFLPLIWFEQKVVIPTELANELKSIPTVVTAGHVISITMFLLGIIVFSWYPIKNLLFKQRRKLKTVPMSPKFLSKPVSSSPTEAFYKKSPETEPEGSPLINKPKTCLRNVKIIPVKQSIPKTPPSDKK